MSHLESLGAYEIHASIGGHGVAAVLKNGHGKTVLLRADIDALPVEERTGLEYASTKRMKDREVSFDMRNDVICELLLTLYDGL